MKAFKDELRFFADIISKFVSPTLIMIQYLLLMAEGSIDEQEQELHFSVFIFRDFHMSANVAAKTALFHHDQPGCMTPEPKAFRRETFPDLSG